MISRRACWLEGRARLLKAYCGNWICQDERLKSVVNTWAKLPSNKSCSIEAAREATLKLRVQYLPAVCSCGCANPVAMSQETATAPASEPVALPEQAPCALRTAGRLAGQRSGPGCTPTTAIRNAEMAAAASWSIIASLRTCHHKRHQTPGSPVSSGKAPGLPPGLPPCAAGARCD